MYNENSNNYNYKNKDYQYYNTDNYDENTQNETTNSNINGMQYEFNEVYQTVPEYSNLPVLKINSFDYEKYPIYETQKPEEVIPIDFSQYTINSNNIKLFTVKEPKKKLNCDPVKDTIAYDEVVKEKPTLFKIKQKKHKKHKEIIKPVTENVVEYDDINNFKNNISSSSTIMNNYENDYIAQDLTLRDVEFFHNYYGGHSQKLRSNIVFPGTIWCGPGNKAPSDNTFGFFFKTDACCRDHDRCFDTIAPREEKYGLYNSGIFTKSHCDCDLDFYVCLKKVNTFVSYKVGYAYFNVLRPQCFRKEYPVIKCVEWLNKRCQVYMLDEKRNEKYQWFDNRYF